MCVFCQGLKSCRLCNCVCSQLPQNHCIHVCLVQACSCADEIFDECFQTCFSYQRLSESQRNRSRLKEDKRRSQQSSEATKTSEQKRLLQNFRGKKVCISLVGSFVLITWLPSQGWGVFFFPQEGLSYYLPFHHSHYQYIVFVCLFA